MDVILDTNILIADIWQNSQNFRFLMDYIGKTNSYVLIPSVVDIEVKAYFSRKVKDAVLEIETATKRAERFGLRNIPPLDTIGMVDATFQTWDVVYEKLFKQTYGRVIPLTQTVVDEAIKRSAYRLPPCKENGDGIRDAFIWLQLLEYCKARENEEPVAFISMNTHDFAGQDKSTLRTELQSDMHGVNLLFYPSLDNFLKEHAKPISYITDEWLTERLDLSLIEKRILDYFSTGWQGKWHREKFKISNSEYREYYQIDDDISDIALCEVRLDNFIVWEFNKNHVELSLDFFTHLEGTTEAELTYSPYISSFDKKEFRSRQVLDCFAELIFHFAATMEGDRIEIGDIDDVNHA